MGSDKYIQMCLGKQNIVFPVSTFVNICMFDLFMMIDGVFFGNLNVIDFNLLRNILLDCLI